MVIIGIILILLIIGSIVYSEFRFRKIIKTQKQESEYSESDALDIEEMKSSIDYLLFYKLLDQKEEMLELEEYEKVALIQRILTAKYPDNNVHLIIQE